MRRTLSFAVALLLAGGLSAPAFAQGQVIISHEMSDQDLNTAELQAFDQLAAANPRMARRLAANPHLANSSSFLNKWPELNDFFAKNPGSKQRFLDDPGNYLEGVHMHEGHLVRAVHKKKSEANPEAAPAAEAPPAAETPPAAPAAPESAPPAAPPSNP
jgi:hypothetical protein